jgi:hypothetical protein
MFLLSFVLPPFLCARPYFQRDLTGEVISHGGKEETRRYSEAVYNVPPFLRATSFPLCETILQGRLIREVVSHGGKEETRRYSEVNINGMC